LAASASARFMGNPANQRATELGDTNALRNANCDNS